MGMDLIETVCRIEEEFEIRIPDESAVTFTTARKVIEYLMTGPEVSRKWPRDYVVISVWLILEDEACINREDFNEDSRFIQDMGMD